MIPARFAGVALAVDPVSGRNNHAVVAAVAGLGTTSWMAHDANTWRVDEHRKIIDEQKAEQLCLDRLRQRALNAKNNRAVKGCADSQLIVAVAELARRCSDLKGAPQDIEWAWDGKQLWFSNRGPSPPTQKWWTLRQSRPLGHFKHRRKWWDHHAPHLQFARGIYEAVYREFCKLMGFPGGYRRKR